MADISQVNLPDGSSFDVKDAIARSTKADKVPAPAEYSSSSTYDLGDFCTYEGNTYVCKTAIATAEDWNTDHWFLCAAQHDYLHSLDPVCNGSFSMNRFTNTYNPTGKFSFTEGYYCVAGGNYSHAEGLTTRASASYSHAEGLSTMTGGMATQAHAEGYATQALGPSSHAEGFYTKARNKSQHVFGEYNVEDPAGAHVMSRGSYVEIVGNGTADDARSNARTLDWNGNEVLAGGLKINGSQNVATQVELTQAEYDALVQAGTVDLVNTVYFITDGNANANSALETTYDNTSSGLSATNVQGAIDEVDTNLSGKQDALTTTSGTITANTSGGWGVNSWLKKYGNIVSFYIDGNKSSALSSGWNTVATLQAGFRPTSAFDFAMIDPGSDYASEGKVNTDGTIQVYKNSNSTQRIRAQATFII